MPHIKVLNGPSKGQALRVSSAPVVLGRDPSCSFQILDKGASRRHAEIFRVGKMVFVRDLGSRNGVLVNDEKIDHQLLLNDDRIIIGNTVLAFEEDLPDVDTDDADDLPLDEALGAVGLSSDPSPETANILEFRLDDIADLEASYGRESVNFRALYKLGNIVTSGKDESSLLKEVFSFLQGILPADNLYIFTRRESSGKLYPRIYTEKIKGAGVSRSIIRRSIRENRSILTTDASQDVRFAAQDSVVLQKVRSVVCVPLTVQERVNGVFYLVSFRSDQPFSEDDLHFLTVAGALIGTALHGMNMADRQRETFLSAIRTLVSISELRDPDAEGHSGRVSRLAALIARELPVKERELSRLRLAALLHDIGKAAVPEKVLRDAGIQNADESHEHVLLGEKITQGIANDEQVSPAIRHHHENWDGSGFPDGLSGDDIPLASRVIAIADGIDHVVEGEFIKDRVRQARKWLSSESARRIDPAVAKVASRVLDDLIEDAPEEAPEDSFRNK